MRWRSRFFLEDRQGEERVRRKFLYFPRCFEWPHWRWLEYAYVRERITKQDVGGSGEWGKHGWYWVEIGFANEEEK